MKKLIISSLILASMSGSSFALTCPNIKDVVHGSRWVIPDGWFVKNELNTPSEIYPLHLVTAEKYGELTCKYLSVSSYLEIKRVNAFNTVFKFDENWRTSDGEHYFCTYNDDENDCSFDIVN